MTIVCLAKVSPLNPATGTRVDLYLSSANDSRVTGLNGQVWEPAMTAAPTLSINLWQGDFQEPVDTGGASFGFNIGILKMTYANADSYMWAGAPVEIYAEEPGTAWPWVARFKGRIAGFSRRNEVVTINAKIDTEPFEKNVLTATYAGTTGAEGGADLKGRLKPLVFGWAKNVEPVLIDTVNSVYQFSAYGAIEAVSVLYERAADFGASVGDHATYAALVAASIPAGRWATCLAAGMVRLGAPAAGVITGDIGGHRVGGTTPRLTGAVISALATIAGVSTGDIETSTLTAIDSAVAYPINIVLTEQSKFIDIAAALALGCNWQSGITLQGKFFALAVTLTGSEVLTLNAQGTALPQVTSSDEQDVSVPYYQTILGAARSWRVHSSDEIAFTASLIERGRLNLAETYREGHVVDLADGSRWLYVNVVATSGNDVPVWPDTANAYWQNLTPPTTIRTTVGGPLPAVANSVTGDIHISDDGIVYLRVNEGGISLDGYAITLAGFRPRIAWTLASSQPISVAVSQANEAYIAANDAIDQLIGLADDDILSRNEKITKLVPEVARLEDKWAALNSIASSLSVSTSAAASARTAWNSFLAGLSPAWNDTDQDTPVSRTAFNAVRDSYDAALYDLDRAVKDKAATLSTWAGVSGAGGQPTGNDVAGTINSGGGVAGNQVSTGAIQPNAVTNASSFKNLDYVPAVSGGGFGGYMINASNYTICTGAFTKIDGSSRLKIGCDATAWSSNDLAMQFFVYITSIATGISTPLIPNTARPGGYSSIGWSNAGLGTKQSDWASLLISDGSADSMASLVKTIFADGIAAGAYTATWVGMASTSSGSSGDHLILPGATMIVEELRR